MEKEIYLSKEGYNELKDKLTKLKSDGRADIAEKIRIARSFGDISENSEYDAAREEEALLEQEIITIEETLRNAKIINKAKVDNSVVNVGCTVSVRDLDFNEDLTFQIVGSYDSDPIRGIISNESPIGKALIGKKKGDVVTVDTPDPTTDMHLKILGIKY